ncbi:MAG: arginase, partial [Firmicutes bacterium]|nr:arginase [Bacillota bacterium]
MKTIEIVGAPMDLGASKRGVSLGPAAIRFAGIIEDIEKMGFTVKDLGDIQGLPDGKTQDNMRHYEQVADMNKKVYEQILAIHERGSFPVLLGGDHSVVTGSVLATSARFGKIGLVWVDAHGDWNNDESTESGNMHGMSFSAACGGGPACMADYGQDPVYVDPKNCVQIGAREVDPKERLRMIENGVTVFSIDKIDKMGIRSVVEQAIEIASYGTAGIHLSFDIDAV